MDSRSFTSKIALVCGAAGSVLVLAQSTTTQASGSSVSDATSFANTARRLNGSAVYAPPPCNLEPCTGTPGDAGVCGSDGKIYLNECFFKNERCRNADKHLTSVAWNDWFCPTTCTKPIACEEIAKFICGSDSNVYSGYCSFYSVQYVDPGLVALDCLPGLVVFPAQN